MLKFVKKTIVAAMACLLAFCVVLPGVAQANVPTAPAMEINSHNQAIETILGTTEYGINSESLAQRPVACLGYYEPNCQGTETFPADGIPTTDPVCEVPGIVSAYCEFQPCAPCPGK